MSLHVKLDEDLPKSLIDILAGRGYFPTTVFLQGWAGTLDPNLWPMIQKEQIYFITADKGFAISGYIPQALTRGFFSFDRQKKVFWIFASSLSSS
jgi:hypothetical protein